MLQENAALIKEINELRRELYAARRAHTTPQKRPTPAKPAAKPAAKTSTTEPAAAPPITAALMVSSARQPPVSSAVEGLAHKHSPDEDANNAAFLEEEGQAVDLHGGDSDRSSDFGILAVGTVSGSQSGDLEIYLDGPLDNASLDDEPAPAAPATAAHGGAAMELSSLHLRVSIGPFALYTDEMMCQWGK